MHVASAELVRLKELIAYKTRHVASVKGKLEAQEQLIVEAVKHE
jgi:tRNA(Ile2) C34 agmatinyltransferase TiaS